MIHQEVINVIWKRHVSARTIEWTGSNRQSVREHLLSLMHFIMMLPVLHSTDTEKDKEIEQGRCWRGLTAVLNMWTTIGRRPIFCMHGKKSASCGVYLKRMGNVSRGHQFLMNKSIERKKQAPWIGKMRWLKILSNIIIYPQQRGPVQ